MKTLYQIFCGGLFIFTLSEYALAAEVDTATIATKFEFALLCKTDPIDDRDPNIIALLDQENIKIVYKDEELLDLEYQFAKPLAILNVTILGVRYLGDSGSYFFATTKGDMDQFAKSIGAKAVPVNLKENISWDDINQYYKFATPATKDNPYPDTILIGRDKDSKPGEFYFGCMRFDG